MNIGVTSLQVSPRSISRFDFTPKAISVESVEPPASAMRMKMRILNENRRYVKRTRRLHNSCKNSRSRSSTTCFSLRRLQVGLQLFRNFSGSGSGILEFIRPERDCRDNRMAATAILFTKFCKVVHPLTRAPGIGANRNLGAQRRTAQADAVHAFRKEIVRDELVIAVQVLIGNVEFDDAVFAPGTLPHDVDGFHMVLMKNVKRVAHLRL